MNRETESWVCADHHMSHGNILKFCPESRPFKDVTEMNSEIIRRHNKVVAPNDHVYMLGDFCFGSSNRAADFLNQMNGIKFFVLGNHDHAVRKAGFADEHFVWMKDYYRLKGFHEAPIIMFHYPMYSWDRMHYGALHMYGHTHGDVPELYSGRGKDIGLDTNDCYPYNIKDLVREMDQKEVVDARSRSEVR